MYLLRWYSHDLKPAYLFIHPTAHLRDICHRVPTPLVFPRPEAGLPLQVGDDHRPGRLSTVSDAAGGFHGFHICQAAEDLEAAALPHGRRYLSATHQGRAPVFLED
jgi:hypothetical protein